LQKSEEEKAFGTAGVIEHDVFNVVFNNIAYNARK